MRKCDVGGQAVIEGVMMRGSKGLATAVRGEDGKIQIEKSQATPITKRYKFLNIPFIRGMFVLIDSLSIGIKSLNYSASLFEDTEPSKFEDWLRGKFGEKTNDIIIGITMCISFVLAIGLFIGVPTLIASFFAGFGLSALSLNLIEAVIRVLILISYIYGISILDDIYRVFQYHGAEHKTIFCYENEEELTVENVRKYSRFHPRCGTNFLFLIMFVSIVIFAFTGWGNFLTRLLTRVILIPVVSGITYEIIKWLGKSDSKLAKVISWPGLKLQQLTTREPEDSQIEVAIASLLAAEGLEPPKKTIDQLVKEGTKLLREAGIETARLDTLLILSMVLKKDKVYLMAHGDERVEHKDKDIYELLLGERVKNKPMAYIIGETEFYGIDFFVQEGVLIPRGDTEILVEEVLKRIPDEDKNIYVCDLCSGSGAIGITLAKNKSKISVDLLDLYEIPEKVGKKNIERHGLEDRVEFIKSDLLESVKDKRYNIIVSNPPYIREEEIEKLMEDVKDYEPRTALSGGEDGLIFYRRIVNDSKDKLIKGGILAFEIGHDQGIQVSELMEEAGYENIEIIKDLAGLDRVVIGNIIT